MNFSCFQIYNTKHSVLIEIAVSFVWNHCYVSKELARKRRFSVLMFTFGNIQEMYAISHHHSRRLLKDGEGEIDERE